MIRRGIGGTSCKGAGRDTLVSASKKPACSLLLLLLQLSLLTPFKQAHVPPAEPWSASASPALAAGVTGRVLLLEPLLLVLLPSQPVLGAECCPNMNMGVIEAATGRDRAESTSGSVDLLL